MNHWFKRALAVLALAYIGVATAAPFSTAPILRVETGSHIAGINTVATDAANRYLVTGGVDKTIRLWSRANGELLKVIRPPIGDGTRGIVRSLAMSPDGALILAGGNFCSWHEAFACALVFDTASGQLVRRIDGLPGMAEHVAWSTDGATVALGLSKQGVRLYRTSDWTLSGEDSDYKSGVNDLHFGAGGRLATAADDQFVRVYSYAGGSLKLTAKKSTTQFGMRSAGYPFTLRFSPDGNRLAVGQVRGAAWVTVHDPATLDRMYSASTNWGRGIGARSVEWSADGEYLYAGTSTVESKPLFIRRWASGGRGFATDLPVGSPTVPGLVALRDGIAFVTLDAIMGVYGNDGRLQWDRGQLSGRFYGMPQALKVSQDGTRVQFAYDNSGNSTLNFDVNERRLAGGEVRDVPMRSAATVGGSLNFYNQWRDTRGALQAGAGIRLAMGTFETSRSLSIAPDNASFVVGSNNQVHDFAANGRQVWSVPQFEAFAVNHSGDGRLVLLASGDGTIRWINAATGRFLAMLYVAPDRKRWVLATPSGFYDSSVGAEDFLGWHINRGPSTESDFIPVSRLRSRFYRPEIVAEILRTGNDARAAKLAVAELAGAQTVAPSAPIIAPPKPAPAPPVAVAPPKPEPAPSIVVAPPKPAPAPPVVVAPPKPESAPPVVAPQRPEPAPPVAVVPPKPQPAPPVVIAPPKPEPAPPVAVAPPKPEPAPPVAVAPPKPEPAPPVAVVPPAPPAVLPAASEAEASATEQEAADVPVQSTVQQTVVDITKVLPPVVTILSPAPGSSFSTGTVTVKYIVRTEADAPLLGVRARVNGLSRDTRNLTVAAVGEVREMTVNVPQEDSEVLLFAENRHGISAAASLKLTYRGTPAARAADAKPVLYVLAVGVSDYENPQYRLNFASKDARDFISVVQKQKGRLYSDVVVKLLADRDATSKQVVEGFEWLQKNVTDKDVGMAFIAGHGLNDEKGRYYFLPANIDLDHLSDTGVPFTQIRGHLSNLKGKGLLFVDTCHSGDVMGGRAGFSTDVNGVLNELSSAEYGLVVLASSTGKQFSLEDPSWGNGAFTKALVEGLNGQADLKHRGRITHKMLDFYVSDRVDELTSGKQTPVNPSPQGVPDYPIAATGI